MRVIPVNVLIMALLLLVASCEDESVKRDYPRVRTLEVTNITENGATFVAEVYEEGNVEITEHGFTWSMQNPDIRTSNRIQLGRFSGTGDFSAEILTTLEEGRKYNICAFVKAGDYTVYGNRIEFTSLGSQGPVITGISPGRALCGDTILIRGRNFSWVKEMNRVIFNETVANICSPVTDTAILVIVPYSLMEPEQTLSVEVSGNRTTFTGGKLLVDLPVMEEITPTSAHWGDTVEITIKNLRPQNNPNVQFGSVILLPASPFDGQKISFVVPWTVSSSENQLKILLQGGEITSPMPFILLPPVINRISPSHGVWSDNILLFGSFNRLKENSTVRFGQYNAQVVYFSADTLIVKVPDNLDITPADVIYSFRDLTSAPVPFSLSPPEIISVSPMNGTTGTNVRIDCKNIKYPFVSVWINDVEIGWSALGGYSYDDTYLYCYIKGSFHGPAYFRVTVCGQSDTWDQPFMVENPYIVSFSPHAAVPGDTITIVAENFVDYQSYFNILEGTFSNMPVVSRNGNVFRAEYPDCDQISGPIYATSYINSQDSRIPSADYLTQLPPVISSVSPATARYNDEITVRGANFSLVKEYNHLSINGTEVDISSCSRDELKFRMPFLPAGSYSIDLKVGGYTVTGGQQVNFLSAWEQLPDLPFETQESFLMNFNGDIIVAASANYNDLISNRKSIYRYDPGKREFSPLGSNISCRAPYHGLVVKGDKAYISRSTGTILQVLDVFDRNTLTLSRVSDLPVSENFYCWLMDGDSILLAGLGTTHLKFNPISGKWTKLKDLPGETNQGHVFTIGGRNFIITSQRRLYEYIPAEDMWLQKSWPSFTMYYHGFDETVVCNGKAYVCSTYADYLHLTVYDPVTDTWESINNIVFHLPWGKVFAFSLEEKLFIKGGNDYYNFWSFDTSWE